jgi:SAM-dependent methyltransferase
MSATDFYTNFAEEWQKKKNSQKHFAHIYLEKPAIFSLIEEVEGKDILCLGCGSGEECDFFLRIGANRVVGIDNSKGLIETAKYSYPQASFHCLDIQKIDLSTGKFDLIFSSLTLHYLDDWSELFLKIKKMLKPGGRFVFSIQHPIKWGAETTRNSEFNSFILGYKKFKKDDNFEIYGDYLNERKIQDELFGRMKVIYYHKPLSTIFKIIRDAGFEVEDFLEPKPIEKAKQVKLDFYETYSKIPLFAVFSLSKKE